VSDLCSFIVRGAAFAVHVERREYAEFLCSARALGGCLLGALAC
jgi:hypothetical protein